MSSAQGTTGDLFALIAGEDTVIDETRRVADRLGATDTQRPDVVAVCLDGTADPDAAATRGPDRVLTVERANGVFDTGSAGVAARADALTSIVREQAPRAVFTPSDPDGRDLATALATRLDAGVITDALVHVRDGGLEAGRIAYDGRAFGRFTFETEPPVVALASDSLEEYSLDDSQPDYESVVVDIEDDDRIVRHAVLDVPEEDLTEADAVTAGGRGLGKPDGFDAIASLADALGTAVGASRPPADDGWVPYDRQIGVTGAEIDAELYVPVAISGDPYHMRAVTADHVIPINADPDARIFDFADLGIVGDAYDVIPALTTALQDRDDSETRTEAEVDQ